MKYLVRNNAVTHPDFNSLLLALLMRNRFLLSNNILGKPTDYKRTRPRLTATQTEPRLIVNVTRRAKRRL